MNRAILTALALALCAALVPTKAHARHRHHTHHYRHHHHARVPLPRPDPRGQTILRHPKNCPARAFCGCGASVHVYGHSVRHLWLASNWLSFPRAQPAAGMAAVRRHHVMVLEKRISGQRWVVYDANSGGHRTRIHVRSIAGYAVVNPRASRMARL